MYGVVKKNLKINNKIFYCDFFLVGLFLYICVLSSQPNKESGRLWPFFSMCVCERDTGYSRNLNLSNNKLNPFSNINHVRINKKRLFCLYHVYDIPIGKPHIWIHIYVVHSSIYENLKFSNRENLSIQFDSIYFLELSFFLFLFFVLFIEFHLNIFFLFSIF